MWRLGQKATCLSRPYDKHKLDCSSGDKAYNNSTTQILFESAIAASFNKQTFHSIQLNTMRQNYLFVGKSPDWIQYGQNQLQIFISVINQLDAQNLFYNKFISCLYVFRAPCTHRQEVKILLYSLWYHHTYRFSSVEWGSVERRKN